MLGKTRVMQLMVVIDLAQLSVVLKAICNIKLYADFTSFEVFVYPRMDSIYLKSISWILFARLICGHLFQVRISTLHK